MIILSLVLVVARVVGRVIVLLLIIFVVRLFFVLNGLRVGSLTRGAIIVGVLTRFVITGGGGGGGGISALIVKTIV